MARMEPQDGRPLSCGDCLQYRRWVDFWVVLVPMQFRRCSFDTIDGRSSRRKGGGGTRQTDVGGFGIGVTFESTRRRDERCGKLRGRKRGSRL